TIGNRRDTAKIGGVRSAYTSQSPPAHRSSRALAGGSPFRRRSATWLMVASTAGAIQTTETIIQGRSRGRSGTRTRYRGRGLGAMGRPFASALAPFAYSWLPAAYE